MNAEEKEVFESNRNRMYEYGVDQARWYSKPHPEWKNPWFLMGFWDAKTQIDKNWQTIDTSL